MKLILLLTLATPGTVAGHDENPVDSPADTIAAASRRAAAFQLLLANAAPAAYNRFVKNTHWSRIGPRSWGRNLRAGFAWDDDHFYANQFAHPYHGSTYFAAARANGFGFWESVPFVFTGSLMWEYFGETYRPSINDWVNTSLGGIALGEVTWRTAGLLLNHPGSRNGKRWRSVAALAVSPASGLNHYLGTDPWRSGGSGTAGHYIRTELGLRSVVSESGLGMPGEADQVFSRLEFAYGDAYAPESRGAFDTFELALEVATGDEGALSVLSAGGLLAATAPRVLAGAEVRLASFLQYQYLSNRAFLLGAQSIRGSALASAPLPAGLRLRAEAGLDGVVLAATPNGRDPIPTTDRDYDYGPGLGWRGAASVGSGAHRWLTASVNQLWIRTLDGAESSHRLRIAQVTGHLPLLAGAGVGLGFDVYSRRSHQAGAPTVHRRAARSQLTLGWGVGRAATWD